MKKIVLLVFLVIGFSAFSQKPKVDAVRYKEVTTTQRDAFIVPIGEHWEIYNITNSRYEYWDGSSWQPSTSNPTTTKGDISTHDGINPARLPVGIDGYVLKSNSSTTTGLEWAVESGGGGSTNLSYIASPTNGTVTSDTGTDAIIPLADITNAGLITPAEKTAIANIPDNTDYVDLVSIQTITGEKTFTKAGTTGGIVLSNSTTGYGLNLSNTSTGRGIYSTNSSTGTGIYSNNIGSGTGIRSNNTSTGAGINSTNSNGGQGIWSTNSSTGTGIYSSNTSTGLGIYSNNSSTGIGFDSYNASTGAGIRSINNLGGIGFDSYNASTGYGIRSNNISTGRGIYSINSNGGQGIWSTNSSTGTGIYSNNSSTGRGIYSTNSSTGIGFDSYNESTGAGIHSINNLGGIGFDSYNASTGYGIYSYNASTGTGIYSSNIGSGNAIVSNGTPTATGFNYVGKSDGVNTFTVSKEGNIIANTLTTVGTISSQGTGNNYFLGNVGIGTTSPSYKLDVTGTGRFTSTVTAASYNISSLNTAPASATDTGTTGEIRITANFIYVCIATNTWVRTALTTW